MNAKVGRWIAFGLGLIAVTWILGMAVRDSQPEGDVRSVPNYKPWDKETLDQAALFPVQDGGRVKPLGTYAGFTMLSLHGARSMDIKAVGGKEVRLKPLDWMMDCIFRPELAKELPTFRLDNSEVLTAVGLPTRGQRDRYSYNELAAGRDKLKELAAAYEQIESDNRKPIESQTIELNYKLQVFQYLTSYMDFARHGLMGPAQGKEVLPVSTAMGAAPKIRAEVAASEQSGAPLADQVQLIHQLILERANASDFGLKLFPPADPKIETWVSAGGRMFTIFTPQYTEPEQSMKDVLALEEAVHALDVSEADFRVKFGELEKSIVDRAIARDEYRSVPLEADYFRKNWLLYALAFFLIATVTSGVMFFTGETLVGRISYWATAGSLFLGLIAIIVPIVKRCIIMQRPPVGNLYDTIIFIDMAFVAFALLVVWMSKRKFALGIAPITAAFLIVLARRFEVSEGKDHLDPLVAVLRSNFWLSTHVITITLGYASGLITAFISVVYVLLRVLGLDGGDLALRRSVTRAAYGCVCLTLCLSLIGTVLGGIWANDSWGRFWGWDPKENGALMIVLWMLAILHARLGGYIREWGLHLCGIFTAIVVTFSWWHVNFLNVGLHNYGFSADKVGALWRFYGVMVAFMIAGGVGWLLERMKKTGSSGATGPVDLPKKVEV
ncbi:cytochrome c biogenesis protein [Luteolibacter sp. Populi]|uniref:cytochrome c biogenesis protein n=1 Tax=Luteolibacter sp. Populi TaxID=3230487 RepID=UPI003467751B